MKIRRAFVQMLIARQVSVLVMALALMVLGRLLTPEEFGLFAMATAVTGIVEVLARFGIPAQLIRLPRMTAGDLRAGQGLALCLGLGAAALLMLGAWLLPTTLWPEGVRPILVLLATTLPVLAVIDTLEAAFNRDLQVDMLARLTVLRQIVESLAAVILALAGFGAVALAAGLVAQRLTGMAGLLWISRHRHGFRPAFGGWRPFGRFARAHLGSGLATTVGDAGAVFVLSRALGLDILGQFNRAKRVVSLLDDVLLTGLQPVVLPAISRSLDAGIGRDRVYLTKTEYLAGLCWPGFAFIALMADEIVLLVMGAQWEAAVPAVRILALAGLVLPLTKMSVNLFVALDAAGLYTRIQSAHQVMRVGFLALGALVSLEAACLGEALSSYIKAAVISVVLKRRTGYSSGAMGRVLGRAAVVTGLTLLGPALVQLLLQDWPGPGRLALAVVLATVGWIAGAALSRHGLLPEILMALGATGVAARLRPEPAV